MIEEDGIPNSPADYLDIDIEIEDCNSEDGNVENTEYQEIGSTTGNICCCGQCGFDASNSEHYCEETGKRVMVFCFENPEKHESFGSIGICKTCAVNTRLSTRMTSKCQRKENTMIGEVRKGKYSIEY